jgi:hypothetical protein
MHVHSSESKCCLSRCVGLRGESKCARGQRVCALALLIIITTMVYITTGRHAISVSVCGRDNCTQPQRQCMREIHACECHYADGRYRTTPIKRVKRVLFFWQFCVRCRFLLCAAQSLALWRRSCDKLLAFY